MSTVFSQTQSSQRVEQPAHITAYTRAKVALMLKADTVFFTSVLFSLKHSWSEAVSTAATDGTQIIFNPDFFMSLDQEERVFLMLHEAMHVALMHMTRLGTRNHRLWNQAADHVINLMLQSKGFQMPSMGLADKRFADMSSEQVYALLEQEQGPDTDPDGDVGGFGADLMEPTAPIAEVREQINDILVRASIRAKQESNTPGSIPGEFQVYLDKLLNPKLPWNRILQKYVQSMAKNDYTFRKPNRRFFPHQIMPSLYSETLIDLAIAVDTSGSVSDEEFQRFVSEVAGIFRMLKPKKISLIQFDTQIKSVDQLNKVEDIFKLDFRGRGGTLIDPVVKWVKENKPQLTLVFTDGEFRPAQEETRLPFIWLIHSNPDFAAPFGKTIHYEATT